MEWILLFGFVIVAASLGSFLRYQRSYDGVMKRIAKLKSKSEDEFMRFIDGKVAQKQLSAYQTCLIKANYYAEQGLIEKSIAVISAFDPIHLKKEDKVVYHERLFELYLKLGDKKAIDEADAAKAIVKRHKMKQYDRLIQEIDEAIAVYFNNDISYIGKYEKALANEKIDNYSKAEYYYRLARLYHHQGSEDKVDECLRLSSKYLPTAIWQNKMNDCLKDHQLLD